MYLRACRAKKQVLNCSLFDPSIEATLSFLGLQNKYKIAAFGLAQLSGIDIFGSDFEFFLSGWGLKTEIEAGVLRGAKPRPRQGHQMVEVGEEIGEEICEEEVAAAVVTAKVLKFLFFPSVCEKHITAKN